MFAVRALGEQVDELEAELSDRAAELSVAVARAKALSTDKAIVDSEAAKPGKDASAAKATAAKAGATKTKAAAPVAAPAAPTTTAASVAADEPASKKGGFQKISIEVGGSSSEDEAETKSSGGSSSGGDIDGGGGSGIKGGAETGRQKGKKDSPTSVAQPGKGSKKAPTSPNAATAQAALERFAAEAGLPGLPPGLLDDPALAQAFGNLLAAQSGGGGGGGGGGSGGGPLAGVEGLLASMSGLGGATAGAAAGAAGLETALGGGVPGLPSQFKLVDDLVQRAFAPPEPRASASGGVGGADGAGGVGGCGGGMAPLEALALLLAESKEARIHLRTSGALRRLCARLGGGGRATVRQDVGFITARPDGGGFDLDDASDGDSAAGGSLAEGRGADATGVGVQQPTCPDAAPDPDPARTLCCLAAALAGERRSKQVLLPLLLHYTLRARARTALPQVLETCPWY